jgi:glycosyltransferase involved in cell wall biosynthesis
MPSRTSEAGGLRLLEVTESFATGTMEVVRLIAEHAAREGHDVTIAYGIRPETPAELRERINADVEVVELPWEGRTLSAQLRAARALRRLCRARQPDLIHLHSSFAGFVGSLAVASMAPTVYTPHGYAFMGVPSRWRSAAYRLAEGLVARRVTKIGTVSESEARLARELGARDVEVVPNGIPELDGPPRDRRASNGGLGVVAMGRIVPDRQPLATARLLAAVSDLADVTWIGSAPDQRAGHAVRAMGIPITGWLDRAGALRRLSRATVLLNWSSKEGHPLSVLEAMALNVVVIGSDIEPNRELLGPEQVCASEDQAAELLREVLTDRDRRDELLEAQRVRSRSFAASRMVADWMRIYERMAANEVGAKPHARPLGVDRLTA